MKFSIDKYSSPYRFTEFSFSYLPHSPCRLEKPIILVEKTNQFFTALVCPEEERERNPSSSTSTYAFFFQSQRIWTKINEQRVSNTVFLYGKYWKKKKFKGDKPKGWHCTTGLKYCWVIFWEVAWIRLLTKLKSFFSAFPLLLLTPFAFQKGKTIPWKASANTLYGELGNIFFRSV